jgi:protocatechuate 3,4-dioxygenase beta subunit
MDTKKIGRREALGMMGAASAAIALGCGSSPAAPSTTVEAAPAAGGSTSAACAVTPAETAGPFPSLTHLFRSDIRDGKPGTPLNLGIKVVNTNAGCAPVAEANVEIWHVDAAGNYSEYGSQRTQNFLRGVQTTNGSGDVSFTTIFPGWYQGRATHIHIEVTMGGTSRNFNEIAFPEIFKMYVFGSCVYV